MKFRRRCRHFRAESELLNRKCEKCMLQFDELHSVNQMNHIRWIISQMNHLRWASWGFYWWLGWITLGELFFYVNWVNHIRWIINHIRWVEWLSFGELNESHQVNWMNYIRWIDWIALDESFNHIRCLAWIRWITDGSSESGELNDTYWMNRMNHIRWTGWLTGESDELH